MKATDHDGELGQYLAAYDDALLAGATSSPDSTVPVPADMEAPFRRLQPLLDLLHRFRRPPQLEIRLQRFRLQRCLGQGGFGIVYLAYDTVLGREVALKLPRLNAFLNPELRARFLREAQAAARLDHPNLVPLHDAGSEGAVSYLVSAYCPGPTLAQWLQQRPAPVPVHRAAELVMALARAVQYMHERGLIHRDLKPSNVILQMDGAAPGEEEYVPRITDFGLAKLHDGEGELSRSGVVLGTPKYLSPEQAAGQPAGPSADLYALGVILYELLTGQPPFPSGSDLEILRQVRDEEPVPPRSLRREVPRDLETICLKCLRKSPSARYATAAELAADLDRFLGGQPIQARPPGRGERLWRRTRRHGRLLAALAAVSVSAAVLLTGLWHQSRRDAELELRQRRLIYQRRMGEAQKAWERHDYFAFADIMSDLRPPPGKPDVRGFEWYYLLGQYRAADILAGHTAAIEAVAYSPDGRLLASGSADHKARLWDVATGLVRHTLAGHTDVVRGVAFTPDGRTLATASNDTTVRLWDVATGATTAILRGPEQPAGCLAFSSDGRTLAAGSDDHSILLWDTATAKLRTRCLGLSQNVMAVAFAPDGQLLASGDYDTLRLWDAATGEPQHVLPVPSHLPLRLAFSADGRLLASGWHSMFRIWDTATWQVRANRWGPAQDLEGLTFSPDGRTLAVGASGRGHKNGAVRLWDVASLLADGPGYQPPQLTSMHSLTSGDVGAGWLSVAVDGSGNRYVAGFFGGTLNLELSQGRRVLDTAGNRDILVAKYGPGGALLWIRTFHGSAFGEGQHVLVDGTGRVWVVGHFEGKVDWNPGSGQPRWTSDGPYSWVLLQLNTEGDLCWAHLIGGLPLPNVLGAALSPEGDLYLSGKFSGRVEFDRRPGTVSLTSANRFDSFLAKYTVHGDCAWARQIGGYEKQPALAVGRDGNVVLMGNFEHRVDFGTTVLTAPQESTYLAKVDRTGNFLWARAISGAARVAVNRVATDAAGHIFITGVYWPRATMGGVPLEDTNTVSVFLARLDENGTPVWVRSAKGSGQNHAQCLALDGAGHLYVGGRFMHRIDFDPGAGGDIRECRAPGAYHAFVWKVDEDGNSRGVWTIDSDGESSTIGLACDARHQLHAVGHSEGASRVMNLTSPGPHPFLAQFQPSTSETAGARYVQTSSGISALAYAPDGRSLALGDWQGQIRIWEPAPPPKAPASPSHQPEECWTVAFSPDGRRLVSGGDNDKEPLNLKVWDAASGKQVWSARHAALVSCAAYSPDGRLIAAGDYANTVRLWQAADGQEAGLLEGHTGAVRCLAFSPDGRLLASGAQDHTVRVWEVSTGRLLQTLQGHANNVRGLVFTPDGRRLVSAGSDATARLWDVAGGRCEQILHGANSLHCVVLSRDGKELFAGSRSGQIQHWDLSTGQEQPTLPGHPKEVRALALCPDGRTLASAGEDGTIMLWDSSTGLELLTLRGHTKAVNGLAFAPGGDVLVSACHDGTIGVWRAPAQ